MVDRDGCGCRELNHSAKTARSGSIAGRPTGKISLVGYEDDES
jgi:hypothetical protein